MLPIHKLPALHWDPEDPHCKRSFSATIYGHTLDTIPSACLQWYQINRLRWRLRKNHMYDFRNVLTLWNILNESKVAENTISEDDQSHPWQIMELEGNSKSIIPQNMELLNRTKGNQKGMHRWKETQLNN